MGSSTAFYAFTAIFYGVVSVSITFFNKLVLNTYQFNYPNVILTLQLALTLAVLSALKHTNLIDYPDFDVHQAKQLLPVGLLYCVNVAVALTSLAKLNIPMYRYAKVPNIEQLVLTRKKKCTQTLYYRCCVGNGKDSSG